MWHLIFLFLGIMNLFPLIYPFLIKIDVRFNILKLKGVFILTIFNKFKLEFKVRIKHGYVYINHKRKTRREKLTTNNKFLSFMLRFANQLYFREQYLSLGLVSNFGYNLDSCVTAVASGCVDIVAKGIFAKLKNNKKCSHIFVCVEPKYNEDIFNIRLTNEIRISIFDIVYAWIYTLIYGWRENEKSGKRKIKQK